jgi:hypothetical protein
MKRQRDPGQKLSGAKLDESLTVDIGVLCRKTVASAEYFFCVNSYVR